MTDRENLITRCFSAWISKDLEAFQSAFGDDAVYIESWGPAYCGLRDITRWFRDWGRENDVLSWDIARFWHAGDTTICEWRFRCRAGGEQQGFDGVSIIAFGADEKIIRLREFQSKTPNVYPYA